MVRCLLGRGVATFAMVAMVVPLLVAGAANAASPTIEVRLPGSNDPDAIAVGDHCVFVDGPYGPLAAIDRTTMTVAEKIWSEPSDFLLAHGDDLFVSSNTAESVDRLSFSSDCTSYTSTTFSEAPLVGTQLRMAWAGGTLWLVGGHDGGPAFGEVDLTTGTVTPFDESELSGTYTIETDPSQPDRIWVRTKVLSAWDLVGGVPQLTQAGDTMRGINTWAPAHDGSAVFGFGTDRIPEFDGTTLVRNNTRFPRTPALFYGAADPTRDRIAALRSANGVPSSLAVWSTATHTRVLDQPLPTREPPVLLRSAPDGANLFAVTRDGFGHDTLWKFPGDPKRDAIHVQAPAETTFGRSATFKASVPQAVGSADHVVRVFATAAGGSERQVAQGSIADGTFRFTTSPSTNTRYRIEWDGDDQYMPTAAYRRVDVRMRARTKLRGAYGASDGYKLFHAGDDPIYIVSVAPNHAGLKVYFGLWRRSSSGSWKFLGKAGEKLNAQSKAGVRILGGLVGYRYRVKVDVPDDGGNTAAKVPWSYFRYT